MEEFYAGIVLVSSGRQITNNTVIHNRVLLSVAGADYLAGITLLDYSAKAGGPVLAVDNIIKHNNLRFSDLGVDLAPDFLDQFNDLRFNVSRDGW